MRLPFGDWLIYGLLIAALLVTALRLREGSDAPPAPPGADAVEGALLGPVTPFDPTVTVNAPDIPFQPAAGTAFAISADGRWLTARHVVDGCRKPAIVVGGGRAVQADVRLAPRADVALLITEGGPVALPLADPQGKVGEVATRLLGRETLKVLGRGERDEPVLAWAEVGRTDGLKGTLSGLSGAPALDRQGRVVGVTIAEAPRRGRIYTTAPDTLAPAVRGLVSPDERVLGEPITVENYGRVSDELRRDLRVAQVVCLSA